ncbi:MAG: peptidoglycan DD-metalloendopeptidase family protein [Clostridia bacterium]|nr:peptidoglycan DD-metalloendopeptidase family protein [Deltaproteobacteria bacterium]
MIGLALGLLVGLIARDHPQSVGETIRTTLDTIDPLARGIAASESTLSLLGNEAEDLTGRVALADSRLANARLRYGAAYAIYRDRIRAVARIPGGTLLVLFGESGSFTDVLRTTKMLRRIAMHDRDAQQRLARETKALQDAEEDAKADRTSLDRVIGRVRETRDTLAHQRRTRLGALQVALADTISRAGVQREMARSHKQLTSMLTRASPNDDVLGHFSAQRGKLPWPVVGKVIGGFDNQGIVIGAVVGDEVQSVAAGRIVYVGWVRGYGQTVIVDHGERHHTVLGHLSDATVHERDIVGAGTLIGHVGESGPTRGASVRFEVHKDGVPSNPVKWLRK